MSLTYAMRPLPGSLLSVGGRGNGSPLFNISLESGNLTGNKSSFDSAVTDSGDLSATLTAGLRNQLTVVGAELVTNGGFDDWTGDNPDNWPVIGESGSDPEVSEVGTGEGNGGAGSGLCNIFTSDGTAISINQIITVEVGKFYKLSFDFDTKIGTGALAVADLSGTNFAEQKFIPVGTNRTIIFEANATTVRPQFKRNSGATDVTVDNISLKEVTGATFGMQCTIDDTTAIYGQMTVTQPASGSFRARFYINADQLEMVDDDAFNIFVVIGNGSPYQLRLKQTSGVRQVQLAMENDVPATVVGTAQTLTSGEHYIELLMTRATTNVSSDGFMELSIDGALVDTLSGIDNFDRVDPISLRLGAVASLDAGTRGHLFLDELVVRDDDKQIGA